MEENACVSDVSETLKKSLVQATEEVVGYKICGRGKKGTAWWKQKMKTAVEEKRKEYKKMLQRSVLEKICKEELKEELEGKNIIKVIVVPNKLVNFVV